MPRPALRSRSLRRILKKIPGGAFTIHYSRRKPSVAKCAKCKKPLKGMARKRVSKLKKIAGSMRKPSRPYGGNLCSGCTREVIKEAKLKR
jgi:large subunit ribosomal protein L34e